MARHDTADDVKRRYIVAMQPELGQVFYALFNQCAWLHLKWGEYVRLFGTSEERVTFLNRAAPGFFHIVQDTLYDEVLLHVCRLTDPAGIFGRNDRQNLSVKQLPVLVRDELKSEVRNLVDRATAASTFARDHRNRRISHADLLVALGTPATPLQADSRQAVQEAIEGITATLNFVETRYCGNEPVLYEHVSHRGDGDFLIYVLERGLQAIQEQPL
jgi:hypothetical protein